MSMKFEFTHMPNYLVFRNERHTYGYEKEVVSETIVRMDKVVCVDRRNEEITITLDTHNQPAIYKFTLDEKSAERIMDVFKQYLIDYYPAKEN